ncbi:MAG: glycosyltransferase [Rikenellaceae bacterium]
MVEELQEQTIVDQMQIVVVDNHSPNESYKRLKPLESKFENLVVLQTAKNLGYAKGNNFALDYLQKNIHPKYVAVLNNDVILPKDCLERLTQRYELLESPAIIAPIMTNLKGEKQTMLNSLPTTWEDFKMLFALYTKLHRSKPLKLEDNTQKKAMQVEVIGGSFMFADFERFKSMGFFYPNTFLYVEERFVAEAAKKMGYKNYIILDQEFIHAHNSPTINRHHNQVSKYKILYQSRREYLRTCKKHGRLKALLFRPFMWLSLMEWRVIGRCRAIRNR